MNGRKLDHVTVPLGEHRSHEVDGVPDDSQDIRTVRTVQFNEFVIVIQEPELAGSYDKQPEQQPSFEWPHSADAAHFG